MDFSITDEQTMLQDSIVKFINNNYEFETRQTNAASTDGFSREYWQMFGELGWTAVPFAEDDGGLGGGAVETMLLMEQFGRGLVLEPYLASVVLAGGVLRRAADDAQRQRWLAGVVDASAIGALAFVEPQSRFELNDVTLRAEPAAAGFRLSGAKAFVIDGGSSDFLVVSARTSGERHDAHGISLFVVDAQAAGITVRAYPTVDGLRAAEIDFDEVEIGADGLLGVADQGLETLSAVVDEATLAVCAEAIGIMEVLNRRTLEYTKNREQFGVPIASFQALQHRMVEMLMDYELSRSLLLWAVMTQESGDAAARRAAISAIKHQVGTAGRKLGQEAVQLHGGMGVSWEVDVAHYFKRLTAIDTLFGNADFHLRRYARLSGAT